MPTDLANLLDGASGQHRIRPERKDIWKIVVGTIFFIGSMILYALEFPQYSRTFEVESLIKWAMIFGGIVGLFVGHRFARSVKDSLEKIKIYLIFFALGVCFMPLWTSLSNRLLSPHPIQQEQVEFVELQAFKQSRFGLTKEDLEKGLQPSGYYLFFVRNDRIERTQVKTPVFEDKKRSEMIDLPIKKGLWGYDIIVL